MVFVMNFYIQLISFFFCIFEVCLLFIHIPAVNFIAICVLGGCEFGCILGEDQQNLLRFCKEVSSTRGVDTVLNGTKHTSLTALFSSILNAVDFSSVSPNY
jgi:hypothetical protein